MRFGIKYNYNTTMTTIWWCWRCYSTTIIRSIYNITHIITIRNIIIIKPIRTTTTTTGDGGNITITTTTTTVTTTTTSAPYSRCLWSATTPCIIIPIFTIVRFGKTLATFTIICSTLSTSIYIWTPVSTIQCCTTTTVTTVSAWYIITRSSTGTGDC